MRTIIAILAFGLFSFSAVAQDYQLVGDGHGLSVALTMDTESMSCNFVHCPILGGVEDCDIYLGTFTYNSATNNITFRNSISGDRVTFVYQYSDVYTLTIDGFTWYLKLNEL